MLAVLIRLIINTKLRGWGGRQYHEALLIIGQLGFCGKQTPGTMQRLGVLYPCHAPHIFSVHRLRLEVELQ